MKKLLLTLLLALAVGTGAAWAETETATFTLKGTAPSNNTLTSAPITVKINDGSPTTRWDDDKIRLYSGGSFDISCAENYKITEIVITSVSGNTYTSSNTTYSTSLGSMTFSGTIATWSAKETLTVNSVNIKNTAQVRITELAVTYAILAPIEDQPCGDVVFTVGNKEITSATAEVREGSLLSLTCASAKAISYTINGGTAQTYSAPISITEACTISAYGYNDTHTGNTTAKSFTIAVAPQSRKFKKITSNDEFDPNCDYVILSVTNATSMVGMGINTNGNPPAVTGITTTNDIVEVENGSKLNIISFISTSTTGSYKIQTIDGKYLSITSGKTDLKANTIGSPFSVSISNTAVATISGENKRSIRCNGTTDFRHYSGTSTGTNVYLYKEYSTELGKVALEGADDNNNITVAQGTTLKFIAANATKMRFAVDNNEPVELTATNEAVEYTVNFGDAQSLIITVTPHDGTKYVEDKATTFTINRKPAELCGPVTFTPESGSAIAEGSTVSWTAEHAIRYIYTINDNNTLEGNEIILNEEDFIDGNCTITVTPVNGEDVKGSPASAEYILAVPDRYALVTNLAHINPNATYILLGCKTDFSESALMGTLNGNYYGAIKLNKSLEDVISILPTDATFSNLSKFNISKNEEQYNIQFANGSYLVRSGSDLSSNETATTSADFNITFAATGAIVISEPNNSSNKLQYNSQSPRFKTYTSAQSPVYLYRLIDEEYDTEVPEELYIHGHFYDRYYDLDNPVAMEKTGDKTFSSSDIMLGGNADHTGDALSFVLTTHIPTESVARSHESADWARLTEGYVYHSGGKVAAADVKTGEEITPYTVDKHDYYTISADFSGYAPVITATRQNGITTGVENVDTDATDAPVEYFNLQGVRVDNPGAGIFIRRQGKTVTKVVVK